MGVINATRCGTLLSFVFKTASLVPQKHPRKKEIKQIRCYIQYVKLRIEKSSLIFSNFYQSQSQSQNTFISPGWLDSVCTHCFTTRP